VKTTLRKFVLAGTFALLTAVVSTPAHATISGSDPRPTYSSSVSIPSSWSTVLLSMLGVY
jgi:hypothetical protein